MIKDDTEIQSIQEKIHIVISSSLTNKPWQNCILFILFALLQLAAVAINIAQKCVAQVSRVKKQQKKLQTENNNNLVAGKKVGQHIFITIHNLAKTAERSVVAQKKGQRDCKDSDTLGRDGGIHSVVGCEDGGCWETTKRHFKWN